MNNNPFDEIPDSNDMLGNMGNHEHSDKWPQTIVDLHGVVSQYFDEHNEINIDSRSKHELVMQICKRLGGVQLYLPKGDSIKKFLRDVEIYKKFNGGNHKTLAYEYDLTEVRIYQIIKEQRGLHITKLQPDLF